MHRQELHLHVEFDHPKFLWRINAREVYFEKAGLDAIVVRPEISRHFLW